MIKDTLKIHKFKQQYFIATGGFQGLGGAFTQRLAASNTTVAVLHIDADASAQMEEHPGGSHQINKIQDSA